jgi:hypothetical protein
VELACLIGTAVGEPSNMHDLWIVSACLMCTCEVRVAPPDRAFQVQYQPKFHVPAYLPTTPACLPTSLSAKTTPPAPPSHFHKQKRDCKPPTQYVGEKLLTLTTLMKSVLQSTESRLTTVRQTLARGQGVAVARFDR